MPWAAVGAVAGAYISSQAAGDAADAQAQSAREANQTQLQMYNQSRQDQMPWLQAGQNGLNRLQYLLGLSPGGSSSSSDMMYAGGNAGFSEAGQPLTADQIRQKLLPQYTVGQSSIMPGMGGQLDTVNGSYVVPYGYNASSGGATIDEAGLNEAVQAQLKAQQDTQAQQQARIMSAQNDPAYGSLMRDFTKADMEADPVYQSGFQFGMDEGQKALDRQAAASGSLLSGAAAKAMSKFANDYASTKGNESFNRWNVQGANKFNRLASIAGVGQTAANQTGAAALSTGNQIAQNQIGVGNARAASAIGSANAWSNGLSQAYNGYQSNQLMNRLFPSGYQSNASGSGYNPYGGYDASYNGGWGIE